MSPEIAEMASTLVAALLTLMVYSYLVRDNPLYRLAEHLLVATSVAYAAIAAYHYVLVPRLFAPLAPNPAGRPDLIIPLVLGILLLAKALPGTARLGTPSVAYLIGVGLGLSVGGALVGTLLPQVRASFLPVLPIGGTDLSGAVNNIVLIFGTIAALLSFRLVVGSGPGARETAADGRRDFVSTLGHWFVMIAYGAFFGGAVLTYLSLLVGRVDFLVNDVIGRLLGL